MIFRTLTPFLSLIIAVLLGIFVIQPQLGEITTLQAEVSEYENAIAKYQEFTGKLDQKLAKKSKLDALENEQLDAFVFDKIDVTQLLVDIEAIAGQYHLLFGNIDVKEDGTDFKKNAEAQPSAELSTADISFEVIGSYDQFKSFMMDMERSLTLFEVTKIDFENTKDGLFQQYKVTVRVYALPKS